MSAPNVPYPSDTRIPKPQKGGRRDLADYSYDLSDAELNRVREENPKAGGTKTAKDMVAVPLSWDEYNKLSDSQRGAIDWNTLLVEAREKDLNFLRTSTDKVIQQQGTDVASIFGEGGNSDTLAINTVNLLKKINFTAVGQDLDEFLSLDRAFTKGEVKRLKLSKDEKQVLSAFASGTPVNPEEYAGVRTAENIAAIDTSLIQSALDAYKAKLTTFQPNSWNIQAALGTIGKFPQSRIAPGYGRGTEDSYERKVDIALNEAYNDLLASPNDQGLAVLYKDTFERLNWTKEDQQMLWDFIDNRTRNEIQYANDPRAKALREALGWK
jgi:hypothetical protein